MYSSGIVRYHPLHDPESQRSQSRAQSRFSIPAIIDPRLYRSYSAHGICALYHLFFLAVAVRGWVVCGRNGGCSAEHARMDVPFGASAVAGIVAGIHLMLFMLTINMESSTLLPIDSSATRYKLYYRVYYLGCIFCCGSAIVDFKYAVRAGVHGTGWGHMAMVEACAVIAGLVTVFVGAVDAFKAYHTQNVAQAFASVPKIKVEDTSSDSKDGDR